MSIRTIHNDAQGLYIKTNGSIYRPGPVVGFDRAYAMDDGHLKAGDKVQASHVAQSPLVRIRLAERQLMWHLDDEQEPEHAHEDNNERPPCSIASMRQYRGRIQRTDPYCKPR